VSVLARDWIKEPRETYVMFVDTLTLFSHSNSVHMLRNLRVVSEYLNSHNRHLRHTCVSLQYAGLI
jgi:hypothetical protein